MRKWGNQKGTLKKKIYIYITTKHAKTSSSRVMVWSPVAMYGWWSSRIIRISFRKEASWRSDFSTKLVQITCGALEHHCYTGKRGTRGVKPSPHTRVGYLLVCTSAISFKKPRGYWCLVFLMKRKNLSFTPENSALPTSIQFRAKLELVIW